jgi:hypothetical protein
MCRNDKILKDFFGSFGKDGLSAPHAHKEALRF